MDSLSCSVDSLSWMLPCQFQQLLALVCVFRPRRFWRRLLLFFAYLTLFLVLIHWVYMLCNP